jgi:hypothetical protein
MQNTAILYDMENLIGGYGKKRLMDISLAKIVDKVRGDGKRTIVMQKAYGNWHVEGMDRMRKELETLGVTPVNVVHYGKMSSKNAADIRLVIDVMEILYTKPLIDTFVIVSGDGDFSSLVTVLKSHGKQVITSAFQENMSGYLKKISDDFITLDDTLEGRALNRLERKRQKRERKAKLLQNPLLGQEIIDIKPVDPRMGKRKLRQQVLRVIHAFYRNHASREVLMENGMNISVFKDAMNHTIKSFNISDYGFEKLSDFVIFAIQGTPLKLIFKAPGDYRLVDESVQLEGFEDADAQKAPIDIHTLANYDAMLSRGTPRIALPGNLDVFWEVCDYLLDRKDGYRNTDYATIIKDLQLILDLREVTARQIVNMLIAVGALKVNNPTRPVKEHYFGLTVSKRSEILSLIEKAAYEKICSLLGSVDEGLLHSYIRSFSMEA